MEKEALSACMKTRIIQKIYIYKRTVKKGFGGPLLRTFNANNVMYNSCVLNVK